MSPASGPGSGAAGSGSDAHAGDTRPGDEIPRPVEAKDEKPAGAESPGPNPLKAEDLVPNRAEDSTGAHETVDRPGTMVQAVAPGPKAEEGPPSRADGALPPKPDEALAPTPAPEPTAPANSRKPGGDEAAVTRPGTSASELSGSTTEPAAGPAKAGWVRIPSKGRLPSGTEADSEVTGAAARPGLDPALERHPRADQGGRSASGSPARRLSGRSGDIDARDLEGTALLPVGLGLADSGSHSAGESRAGAGSSRVEPSLHTVTRGENFWTISRLYYGDGRYYRALWKANAQKYPKIDELYLNDVIDDPGPRRPGHGSHREAAIAAGHRPA